MRVWKAVVVTLVLATAMTGCGALGIGDCDATGRFGLSALVRDSLTLGPPSSDARVIARQGTFADTARRGEVQSDGALFLLLVERTGVFDVIVEATGYQRWQRSGVAVTREVGRCSPVRTTGVVAFLQR